MFEGKVAILAEGGKPSSCPVLDDEAWTKITVYSKATLSPF